MNMKRRKIRTFLTVLGVAIGVISVVSLLSIGIGVKRELVNTIIDSGTVNQIVVYSAQSGKHKDRMITDRTLEAFETIEGVADCYPRSELTIELTYGKYTFYGSLYGIPAEELEKLELTSGSENLSSDRNPVLVIGSRVTSMFYNEATDVSYTVAEKKSAVSLIGQKLDMSFLEEESGKTYKVKVAGVISEGEEEEALEQQLSDSTSEDEESLTDLYSQNSLNIYCDIDLLTSLLKRNSNNGIIIGQPVDETGKNYNEFIYSSAVITADSLEEVDALVKKFQDMGYETENNKEYLNTVQKYLKIFELLIGGIGLIALVVAVIGISNTMTTSVFDRVNEIGILKVLGCNPDELSSLFLMEAGIIGFAGGVFGVGISYIVKLGIDKVAVALLKLPKGTDISYIPWWLALVAIFGSLLLGVLAGFCPAKWASRLNPLEAVRAR
jgi:ABC-type antimicrobial peptide transport system permease subunit